MAEKRTPHHDLAAFKTVAHRLGVTTAVLLDAAALGYDRSSITDALLALRKAHFHKSMTSYRDETEWQDVYHPPHANDVLYVKFRSDALFAFVLLSFKER